MQDAMDSVREICDKMNDALAQEKSNVRRDQSELKSHLEDLKGYEQIHESDRAAQQGDCKGTREA